MAKNTKSSESAIEGKGSGELDQSFARSLCAGQILEDIIFPYPKMKEEEKSTCRSIIDTIHQWLEPKRDEYRKWDVEGHLPDSLIQEMKQFGFFGLIIPELQGGIGLSTTAYSRIIQELSRFDGSAAITIGAHSSIGMRGLLMFGTEEQKALYLPKLATGEMIAAYCLTEAGSGSDAGSIKTKAVKEGDEWILNGEKLWITNGGIADFYTVFARTDTPEGKITAFLVTRSMPGVSSGPHEDKMGIRASSTTTVRFENVRVPANHVLGEVGKGFKVAVKILNNGRTGLGGGSVGGMKQMISLATQQAKMRKQFGQSIVEFGLIKQKLGQMVIDCYTAESVVNMVSGMIDQKYTDYAVEAAISKVVASENLWRTADEALQIAGGNGFMREFPYERTIRDCRINRIFEGTNEILHLFIALTAMADAAEVFKDVKKSVEEIRSGKLVNIFSDPIKGFGPFVQVSKRWLTNSTGIGKAAMTRAHPALATEQEIFVSHARMLTALSDKLIVRHGKNIIHKQFATKRLAQVIIDLYTLACTLSRVTQSIEEKGLEGASEEIQIAKAFAFQADERIRVILNRMDKNDDEVVKGLADFVAEKEKFPWDNI
jgi:acyl-CoA dehydrogenase family protein 9